MSILNGPRINFFGGIEVDVSVPNNSDSYYLDENLNLIPGNVVEKIKQQEELEGKKEEERLQPISLFDSATSTMTPFVYEHNMSDDQINTLLRKPSINDLGEQYFTEGGWNIYGQHSVVTNSVKVSSSGLPRKVSTQSPFTGFPISLLGSANPDTGQTSVSSAVMVDLNPLGQQYSQIVLGGLLMGDIDKPLLHLQGDYICSNIGSGIPSGLGLDQKILNKEPDSPGSSIFSGTWQVTFSKDQILAYGNSGNGGADAAIKEMIQAVMENDAAQGIVVVFTFFEMCPKYGTNDVRESYYTNQNERNPSVGRIVGTVGVAYAKETKMFPDGRMLMSNVTMDTTGGHHPKGREYDKHATSFAETFATNNGEGLLAINMITALTQENFRTDRTAFHSDTINPAINMGDLVLKAGNTKIGTFTPDYENYFRYGGIVDVELNENQFSEALNKALTLCAEPNASPIKSLVLNEQPYRIYSDSKNVYMGEDSAHQHLTELQVRYLGQAIPEEVEINVERCDIDGLNTQHFLDLSKNTVSVAANQLSSCFTLTNQAGKDEIGGFEQVLFSYKGAKFLVNTRKYQFSDFGIPQGECITWDQVYRYALRFHYLNFPGMSAVFPLNLEQTITKHGQGIKLRTSSKYWPTTLYMPIVRSMSPSQVRLINAFTEKTGWDPKADI